jgi:AcrR family transcriptional regulator
MHAMTDAAVALFSEEGYSAVSTRRIAERAGCSETLLFRYFGDKHGLLMAVCNGLWDEGRPERSGADDFQTVQEYLEYFFLREISDLKHVAPSLKVVIAALINDPEMSADFNQKHDAAAERVAKELRRFQETGAISADVDVNALADGIEQLGFAVGFFLQLIFQRSEEELTAIAVSTAAAMSKGLQANAAQPLLEPRRRKALAAVLGARESLDGIVELLGDAELTAGATSRNGSKGSDRSRA